MKRVLLFISIAMIMVGCNNPLEKSITKELSTEEIKSICKNDPNFLSFYDKCFENLCYKHFITDKTVQILYEDVTYQEFYDYYKKISDNRFCDSVMREVENEWNKNFGYCEYALDSIINHWKPFYDNKGKTNKKTFDNNIPDEIEDCLKYPSLTYSKEKAIKALINKDYFVLTEIKKIDLFLAKIEDINPNYYKLYNYLTDCNKTH